MTDVGESLNSLQDLVTHLGGETLPFADAVDMLGALAQEAYGALNGSSGDLGFLELDDVLSRNDLSDAGSEKRGADDHRWEDRKKKCELHLV